MFRERSRSKGLKGTPPLYVAGGILAAVLLLAGAVFAVNYGSSPGSRAGNLAKVPSTTSSTPAAPVLAQVVTIPSVSPTPESGVDKAVPGKTSPAQKPQIVAKPVAPAAAPDPGPATQAPPASGRVLPIPSPVGKNFNVSCDHPPPMAYGSTGRISCSLDGWVHLPIGVTIIVAGGSGLPGPCFNESAFTASPARIPRSPHEAPTGFTVFVDTVNAGSPVGHLLVRAEYAGSYATVPLTIESWPEGKERKTCPLTGPPS